MPGNFSSRIRLPGPKADHLLCAEVKNIWKYTFTPPYAFMCYLYKHRATFDF